MLIKSAFYAPWWLRNPHLQTLWLRLFQRNIRVQIRRERWELPDGDFLDLDFTLNDSGPVVLVLHGLQGSIRSPYAAGILNALSAGGYRGVLMHFRGCSEEPNRLPRLYHSGETGDAAYVIEQLRMRFPDTPIAAIGYSLGGNALLKLLGETGANSPIKTAIAISAPLLLDVCANRINTGFSKLYQRYLLKSMIAVCLQKHKTRPLPGINIDAVKNSRSFWDFDNELTSKIHGFKDVHDYYQRSSARQYLKDIRIPTLIIHAEDDPFTTEKVIPNADELSPTVTVEVSRHGGHVGFITGNSPFRMKCWLEERIVSYLDEKLKGINHGE
jgi:hypothetical protein